MAGRFLLVISLALCAAGKLALAQDTGIAPAPLSNEGSNNLTNRWAADVNGTSVTFPNTYPRPQMVRPAEVPEYDKDWTSLDGYWEFTQVAGPTTPAPGRNLPMQILVPYPPESVLSGLNLREVQHMLYRRTFVIPPAMQAGDRLLLHFEAVDWESTVYVNGQNLGTHSGGYTHFSYDITDAVSNRAALQELSLYVYDPTEDGEKNLMGKQRANVADSLKGGINYLGSSGIWQRVWLEVVPAQRIERLNLEPSISPPGVLVTAVGNDHAELGDFLVVAQVVDPANASDVLMESYGVVSQPFDIRLPNDAKLWTPDYPNVYNIVVKLTNLTIRDVSSGPLVIPDDSAVITELLDAPALDEVRGYTGLRTITSCFDDLGALRMCLNGKPFIPYGTLDQGMWPESLYSAPTPDALIFDLQATKRLGFNLARKHVKVEPAIWYHWCDLNGLVVWQDVPSPPGSYYALAGDTITCCYSRAWNSSATYDHVITPDMQQQYLAELQGMMADLQTFPCIITFIMYNEAWGQPKNGSAITRLAEGMDGTRLFMGATGWFNTGELRAGSFIDTHDYGTAGPTAANITQTKGQYISSVGEMGGLSLRIEEHTQFPLLAYGPSLDARLTRSKAGSASEWLVLYERQVQRMILQAQDPTVALSAAVFTELTDVQYDITGILTYDRAVIKVDEAAFAAITKRLVHALA